MYDEDFERECYECGSCAAMRFAEDHRKDHLMGLQAAMMARNISDIAFHLEEICSTSNAEFIYKADDCNESGVKDGQNE